MRVSNLPSSLNNFARLSSSPQRNRVCKCASSSKEDSPATAPLTKHSQQPASRSEGPPIRLSQRNSQIALFSTAILWGTNPVCLRYLDLSGHPPSPAVVTAAQSTAAAIWLRLLYSILQAPRQTPLTADTHKEGQAESLTVASTRLLPQTGLLGNESGHMLRQFWNSASEKGQIAAIELGCWTFCANAATVIGFEETSASRGAFLIRLTAVFTPFVALSAGQTSAPLVWVGSAIAFIGGLLISLSQNGGAGNDLSSISQGDLIMAGAAVIWSCQTVRLGKLVEKHEFLELAYRQMTVNAVLCCGWCIYEQLAASGKVSPFFALEGWHDPWRWVALLWPAVGPWGLGTVLQMAGQQSVSPAQTQIILASDPVWATLFAGLVLGGSEQQLGMWGWIGAVCILTASLTSRE